MKIALFCTNEFAIPLRKDIIYAPLPLFENLVLGIAQKGHQVFLYASKNSELKHKNIKIISNGLVSFDKAGYKKKEGSFHDQEALALYEQILISQMIDDAKKYKFDVIHCYHQSHHFLPFLNLAKTPVVFTIHDPMADPTNDKKKFIFKSCNWRNLANYISISNSQRLNYPSLNYVKTIYNGIDLSLYKFNPTADDYFVFLGRICPEKGTDLAVRAAKKANVKLKVMGPDWGGKDYWNKKIKPFWDDRTMEKIEIIPHKEVRKILSKAKGLLFTSQWAEPFGLTMIEAMACGTPVIAIKKGSVPEVVADRKTGFFVNSAVEMAKTIAKIDIIDRKACRKHVEKNFSLEKMINEYERVYKKLSR